MSKRRKRNQRATRQATRQATKEGPRRQFIKKIALMAGLGTAVAVGAAGIVYASRLFPPDSFAQAKNCVQPTPYCDALRSRVTQELARGISSPYVVRVVYGPPTDLPAYPPPVDELPRFMGIDDAGVVGGDFRSPIYVFSPAFDGNEVQTPEDFKSALAHEVRHLRQINENIDCPVGRFLLPEDQIYADHQSYGVCMELAAYREELKNPRISQRYRVTTQRVYVITYEKLWSDYRASPSVIEQMKRDYFEPWMRGRKEFGSEGGKAFLMHGGKKLYLPDAVAPQ